MRNKIYSRGIDYYCPKCHSEIPSIYVYNVIKNGGICGICETVLDKGETTSWITAEGKEKTISSMTTQHISNSVWHLLYRISNENYYSDYIALYKYKTTIKLFIAELDEREEELLDFVPYYKEKKLYNTIEKPVIEFLKNNDKNELYQKLLNI